MRRAGRSMTATIFIVFLSGALVYVILSKVFPAAETLLEAPIYDNPAIIDVVERTHDDGVDGLWEKEAVMLEAKEGE